MMSHQQCAGYSGAVNGFRIILRSSGQQGHRHAPAPRQAPLGAEPDRRGPRSVYGSCERARQWAAEDLIKSRPALSRWHPDYKDAFQRFMEEHK